MVAKRIAGAFAGAFAVLGALSVVASPSVAVADPMDETKDVQVMVAWYDEGHEDERPDLVVVRISADDGGEDDASSDLTITTDDEADASVAGLEESPASVWAKVAEGLPRYSRVDDETGEGVEAEYRYDVEETPAAYSVDFPDAGEDDTCLITFTYIEDDPDTGDEPDTGDDPHIWNIRVVHRWDDEGNEDKRPESITYRLMRDEEEIDSLVMTADDPYYAEDDEGSSDPDPYTWSKAFDATVEEPWSEDEESRNEFFSHYRIELDPIDGYTNGDAEGVAGVDTDTYVFYSSAWYEGEEEPEPTESGAAIRKKWVDKGHEDARPDSISVRLLRDGEEVDRRVLREEDAMVYVMDGDTYWIWFDVFFLDEEDDEGNRIEWSLTEDDVEDYENTDTFFSDVKTYGWILENTYKETAEEPAQPEEEAPQTPAKPIQAQPRDLPQMGGTTQSIAAIAIVAVISAIGLALSGRIRI